MGLSSLLQNLIKVKPNVRKQDGETKPQKAAPVIEQIITPPADHSEQRQSRLKRTKSIVFGDGAPARKDRSPEKPSSRSRSRSILGRRINRPAASSDVPDVPTLPPREEWSHREQALQSLSGVTCPEPQSSVATNITELPACPPQEQAERRISRRERTKSILFGNGVPALKDEGGEQRRPRSRSVFGRREAKTHAAADVPDVPALPSRKEGNHDEQRPRARSVIASRHRRQVSSTDLPAVPIFPPLRDQSYDAQRSRSRSVAARREIGPPSLDNAPVVPLGPVQDQDRGRQVEKTDSSSPRSNRRQRARTTTSPPARTSLPPPPPPPITASLPNAARARSASRSRKTRSFIWASSNPADDEQTANGAPPMPDLERLREQLTMASQSAASAEITYNRGPNGKRDSAIFVTGPAKTAYVPRSAMKGFLQTTSGSPPSQARLEAAKIRRYTMAADSRPILDRSEFVI